MATLYTKKTNRQWLAEEAASLLIPEPKSNAYSRTSSSGAGHAQKKADIQKMRKRVGGEAGLEPAKA